MKPELPSDWKSIAKGTHFFTHSGVLVEATGPPQFRENKWKVPCNRVDNWGWHGWLKIINLHRLQDRK